MGVAVEKRQRRQYPFGLKGPFEGVDLKEGKYRVRYEPNPKQFLAHNCCADEVFYGGATFGGKSFFLIWHTAMHCLTYKAAANTIIFRRTYRQLEETIIQEFKRLFDGKLGTYRSGNFSFEWKNGAKTWFCHMETKDDIQKHQGSHNTLIAYDELTHFEEPMYTMMLAWNRSATSDDVHCQIISASNPGGIGHKWVFHRFIKDRDPMKLYWYQAPPIHLGGEVLSGHRVSQIYIPALAVDNRQGLKRNPYYLSRMKQGMSEQQFRAYAEADWDFFEGMTFPEWNATIHVIDAFAIPPTWKVIRTADWGYRTPFHIGWLAQDPDTGAVYLIDEVYGQRRGSGGAVLGAEKPPSEVRQEIENHERSNIGDFSYPDPRYGVGDPSMWSTRGGEISVGDMLNENGVLFRAANRDRVARIQAYHSLLKINPVTGKPGFRVFKNCRAFITTFPQLPADEKNPEDVDTKAEDHAYDSVGYGLVDLIQAPALKQQSYAEREKMRRANQMPVYA